MSAAVFCVSLSEWIFRANFIGKYDPVKQYINCLDLMDIFI
ncbi:hypothetical protein HMPREF1986_00080 [Oribacterium sp. oral taxon 078 str. F0263]|nr:hypothetical protein HMPREF1986_00080 [Oribacterium sp. oral taxon 078 str. F0263]